MTATPRDPAEHLSLAGPKAHAAFGDLAWVMASEFARGNVWFTNLATIAVRADQPIAQAKYPLDRAAIEAEFTLAPHIGWHPNGTSLVDWDLGASLSGGVSSRGLLDRAVHRRWWRRWDAAPRPPRLIGTPIDETRAVTGLDEAERKLRRYICGRARARVLRPSQGFPEGVRGSDGYYVVVGDGGVWHTGIVENDKVHTVLPHADLDAAVRWLIEHWRAVGLVEPDR